MLRSHAGRLVAVAAFGAVIGPFLFAWGVQRTSATSASLALNLEAPATALLAALVLREHVGGRVALASIAIALGGALLVWDRGLVGGRAGAIGLAAVVLATLAWATDNTLVRPLADLSPVRVVVVKSSLGAITSLALGRAFREPSPTLLRGIELLAIGVVGYGVSLRLYLEAQRRIGGARTASLFALAPFVGAGLAWAIGDGAPSVRGLFALGAMAVGVLLHATERHAHAHRHARIEHEHLHRHDDGHHAHTHDPMPPGEHAHSHVHEPMEHAHAHGPDLHHDHSHSH